MCQKFGLPKQALNEIGRVFFQDWTSGGRGEEASIRHIESRSNSCWALTACLHLNFPHSTVAQNISITFMGNILVTPFSNYSWETQMVQHKCKQHMGNFEEKSQSGHAYSSLNPDISYSRSSVLDHSSQPLNFYMFRALKILYLWAFNSFKMPIWLNSRTQLSPGSN